MSNIDLLDPESKTVSKLFAEFEEQSQVCAAADLCSVYRRTREVEKSGQRFMHNPYALYG